MNRDRQPSFHRSTSTVKQLQGVHKPEQLQRQPSHSGDHSAGSSSSSHSPSSPRSHEKTDIHSLGYDEFMNLGGENYHLLNHELQLANLSKPQVEEVAKRILGWIRGLLQIRSFNSVKITSRGGDPEDVFSGPQGSKEVDRARGIYHATQKEINEMRGPLEALYHAAQKTNNLDVMREVEVTRADMKAAQFARMNDEYKTSPGHIAFKQVVGDPSKYHQKIPDDSWSYVNYMMPRPEHPPHEES